jgi:hypothetical protein
MKTIYCRTCSVEIESIWTTDKGVEFFCERCQKRLSPGDILWPPARKQDAASILQKNVRRESWEDGAAVHGR